MKDIDAAIKSDLEIVCKNEIKKIILLSYPVDKQDQVDIQSIFSKNPKLEEGLIALHNQSWKHAISLLNQAILNAKIDAHILSMIFICIGFARISLGELEMAFVDLTSSLQFTPNNGLANLLRGLIFIKKNINVRAKNELRVATQITQKWGYLLEDYKKFLTEEERRLISMLQKSDLIHQETEMYRHIDFYTSILKDHKCGPLVSAILYCERGRILLLLKRDDEAFIDLTAGTRYNPTLPHSFLYRAIIYLNNGYQARAVVDFNSAIKLQKPNLGIGGSLSESDKKRLEIAMNTLDPKLLQNILDKKDLELLNKAKRKYQKGDLTGTEKEEGALQLYTRLIDKRKTSDEAYRMRGKVRCAMIEKLLGDDNESAQQTRLTLADEAKQDFKQALWLNPISCQELLFCSAEADYLVKNYDSAIYYYTQVINVTRWEDKLSYHACLQRGSCYEHKGDYLMACLDYQKCHAYLTNHHNKTQGLFRAGCVMRAIAAAGTLKLNTQVECKVDESVNEDVLTADNAYQKSQFDKAIRYYIKGIEGSDDVVIKSRIYLQCAKTYIHLNMIHEARSYLDKCEKNAAYYVYLGLLLSLSNQPEEAYFNLTIGFYLNPKMKNEILGDIVFKKIYDLLFTNVDRGRIPKEKSSKADGLEDKQTVATSGIVNASDRAQTTEAQSQTSKNKKSKNKKEKKKKNKARQKNQVVGQNSTLKSPISDKPKNSTTAVVGATEKIRTESSGDAFESEPTLTEHHPSSLSPESLDEEETQQTISQIQSCSVDRAMKPRHEAEQRRQQQMQLSIERYRKKVEKKSANRQQKNSPHTQHSSTKSAQKAGSEEKNANKTDKATKQNSKIASGDQAPPHPLTQSTVGEGAGSHSLIRSQKASTAGSDVLPTAVSQPQLTRRPVSIIASAWSQSPLRLFASSVSKPVQGYDQGSGAETNSVAKTPIAKDEMILETHNRLTVVTAEVQSSSSEKLISLDEEDETFESSTTTPKPELTAQSQLSDFQNKSGPQLTVIEPTNKIEVKTSEPKEDKKETRRSSQDTTPKTKSEIKIADISCLYELKWYPSITDRDIAQLLKLVTAIENMGGEVQVKGSFKVFCMLIKLGIRPPFIPNDLDLHIQHPNFEARVAEICALVYYYLGFQVNSSKAPNPHYCTFEGILGKVILNISVGGISYRCTDAIPLTSQHARLYRNGTIVPLSVSAEIELYESIKKGIFKIDLSSLSKLPMPTSFLGRFLKYYFKLALNQTPAMMLLDPESSAYLLDFDWLRQKFFSPLFSNMITRKAVFEEILDLMKKNRVYFSRAEAKNMILAFVTVLLSANEEKMDKKLEEAVLLKIAEQITRGMQNTYIHIKNIPNSKSDLWYWLKDQLLEKYSQYVARESTRFQELKNILNSMDTMLNPELLIQSRMGVLSQRVTPSLAALPTPVTAESTEWTLLPAPQS